MAGKVQLVAYDPGWMGMAAEESAKLVDAMGDALVRIEHIGSTSVPGLKAKPIIDLLPIVTSLAAVDAKADAVEAIGYRARGEFGIPGRRYFSRDDALGGQRAFNVHVFAVGDPGNIDRHVAFRDYLIRHAPEALAYQAEKERAAALHADDSGAYSEAKSAWIRACQTRAFAWWCTQPPQSAGPSLEPINVISDSSDPAVRPIGNFAATPFDLDGHRYASVESFWQGLKFPDAADRARLAALDGARARGRRPAGLQCHRPLRRGGRRGRPSGALGADGARLPRQVRAERDGPRCPAGDRRPPTHPRRPPRQPRHPWPHHGRHLGAHPRRFAPSQRSLTSLCRYADGIVLRAQLWSLHEQPIREIQ